jgi:hypothetical protein
VEVDVRNEKINYKVREHSLTKTPVIAVVGRKEAETGQVRLRRFGSDGQQILPSRRRPCACRRRPCRPMSRARRSNPIDPTRFSSRMNGFVRPDRAALQRATTVVSPLAVDVSVIMVVYMTGPALFDSIGYVLNEPAWANW